MCSIKEAEMNVPEGSLNVLALIKGKEKYVFLYKDVYKNELLRLFARYASNNELSFTWYDAAFLSNRLKDINK